MATYQTSRRSIVLVRPYPIFHTDDGASDTPGYMRLGPLMEPCMCPASEICSTRSGAERWHLYSAWLLQVQACARMQAARRQLQRAQRAATLIQAHWRRTCAMRLRRRTTAAICIQR